MVNLFIFRNMRAILCALLVSVAFSAISQNAVTGSKTISNSYGISENDWKAYLNKTNLLSEKIDVQGFINYVVFNNDGNFYDMDHFLNYVKGKMKKDKQELVYRVGKGAITTTAEISKYYSDLQPVYNTYYLEFKKRRDQIVKANPLKAPGTGSLPTPFNCGSPCTNPGFESGTTFWDYYTGVACASSTSDPCSMVAGYSSSQHVIQTVGGSDPVVGAALPIVPPGGGNNTLMLGDGPMTGGYASRASISFTVSAANANFTYRYACVLQDPVSGHTDPERPYFNVHLRDGSGNLINCGEYMVMAKPPIVGFTETSPGSAIWYRNWTTVFVPLSSYIGQCVTVQFTSSDCSQGGHYGYAYIDGDCDPLTLLSSSPSVCGGSTVILTAPAGGASYAWTNTAGGTTGIVGSTTGQTCTVNAGGTYQCVITSVAGPSCTTTLNIAVGSSPANPVASFTNTTVCAGTATAFTDTSTPVGSVNVWSWDFNGDGIEDSNLQNPSYTFATAGTYPVTLLVSWGPCNSTITQNVTVNAGSPPAITPAGPFCSTVAPVNLVGTPAGGTWSGTGITNAAAGTFDPSVATVGNNIVTYTVTAACGGSMTATVVVNGLPVSDAGPDVTICSATTGNLGTTTTAGYTYAWTAATGLSSTSISNPTVTLTNGTPAPVTSTYIVTTTSNGCTSTDAVDVIVNPLATANAGPAQTICVGSAVILAGTVGGAATSGTWGGGGGSYSPNNTLLNAVYTPSAAEEAAGSVTLTLVSNDPPGPCPVATSTMTITINPVATINAGPDQTICIGGSAALSGSYGGSAISGTWTGGSGAYSTASTDPSATYTPTAAEETAGAVTLTFTSDDPAGPCPAVTDQVIITISALPSANAGIDQTICEGSSAILAGAIGGAASSGTWTGGAGFFSPNNTTLNAAYTPTAVEVAAGSVTLTLTTNDPAGPCTFALDQMIITINPIAMITAGPDQTICNGSTVTLAGAPGGSASTGMWSGGAGAYTPGAATANAVYTPTAAEEAAGSVTLTFTSDDPAGPCPAVTDQMIITINQQPTANAGSSQSVCSGSTITLAGLIGGSASSGTWSGGGGTFSPNASTLNAVYTPTATEYAAGTVTLTLTTDDPAGPCTFSTSSVTHNFYPNPVIAFTVDDPDGCPIHCAQFTDLTTVIGGNTIVSWAWDFGDGGTSSLQDPGHCFPSTAGYYDVTLTATTNNGCSSTLLMPAYIRVFPEPVADFNPTPNQASILNSTVTLNNASSSDVSSWWYYFGDGDSIAPNTSSPVHDYPNIASGSYMATLIVQNTFGCYDTISHPVEIGPEFTFFIPNAFTPNGDGVNDFFFGQGIGIVDYDLWIFDRWGNQIFHGDELDHKWDGRANGGDDVAQQDVYVWKVKLTDVFDKKHNYLGTVTLVK